MRGKGSARDFGLRSDSFTTDYPDDVSPRIIANIEADQKIGKTDFALRYAPDPIIIYNFDQGLEGVVGKIRREFKKKIIVAGVPTNSGRFPSYHFARPVPKVGEGRKEQGYLERVKGAAVKIWERWISDFREGLESDARTLVVDTGGGAFALGKFSFHGMDKATSKDDPYGQKGGELKAIFQGLVTDGYSYDKNVLWIHRLKEKWEGGQPSGKYVADGYNQIAFEVQTTIRLKKDRRGDRIAQVRDCRLDPSMEEEPFTGRQYRFSTIAALLTGTDEDLWE